MPNGPLERDDLSNCNSSHTTLDQESPGSIPGGRWQRPATRTRCRPFALADPALAAVRNGGLELGHRTKTGRISGARESGVGEGQLAAGQ